jgi:gliding motility-associated-like protein
VSTIDATGCPGSDTYTLNSKQVPVLSVTADKTAVPKGETVQLNASGADNYEWTPAESLNDPLIADPVASPSITTLYTVTGTLTGECSAQAQITITVDGEKIFITVPPAFSPNGDGVNEMLVIDGITEYQDCVLTIFDGRGRRIYEQKSYNNDWNGTYQGRPVPDGTYFYVFGCPTNERPVTGSVLVFR